MNRTVLGPLQYFLAVGSLRDALVCPGEIDRDLTTDYENNPQKIA